MLHLESAVPTYLSDSLLLHDDHRDPFTAAIVIAFLSGHDNSAMKSPILFASITFTIHGELTYHALQLASQVPVRNILAIAGESFVLGQKIHSIQQFDQAKTSLLTWTGTEAAAEAMYHAAKILRLAFGNGPVGMLIEDWTLYLAALVCWATGIWGQGGTSESLGYLREDHDVDAQMQNFLMRFTDVGDDIAVGSGNGDFIGTRACLAWTLKRIAGRGKGGLITDAEYVLKKLLKRIA